VEKGVSGISTKAGQAILKALGFAPEVRTVVVPDGSLGLIISPARSIGKERGAASGAASGGSRYRQEIESEIPSGWLRIESHASQEAPRDLETGDIILRVNAVSLDDFDFQTAMRILKLARNRKLTIVKRQVSYEEAMMGATESNISSPPQPGLEDYWFEDRMPRYTTPSPAVPLGRLRGWHLVSKKIDLRQLRGLLRGGAAA